MDATEWYFPLRLALDVDGASRLGRNPVAKLLGLHEYHRRTIGLPFYALQTDLTARAGAARRAAAGRVDEIPARRLRLVDARAPTATSTR